MQRDPWFILFRLPPERYSWRGLWLLLILFIGSLLMAGVLSPLFFGLFEGIQSAHPNDLTAYLIKKGLPKTFDRLRWLPILIGFPWLMHYCGLLSWSRLGLSRCHWRLFLPGFVTGLLMMGGIAACQGLAGNWNEFKAIDASSLIGILVSALLGGLLIGLLEETLFRGLVLRLFYSAVRPWPAYLLSAAFFAWLHFKKLPPEIWSPEHSVHWWSGLYLAFWTAVSLISTFNLALFLNLLMTGLFLNLVYARYHSLWPGIGLHAGWVVFMLTYKNLFDATGTGWTGVLFGTERFIDGLMPGLIMAVLIIWLIKKPMTDGKSDFERCHVDS